MALWGMAEKFKINRAPALMDIGHAAIKIDFHNAELERSGVFANPPLSNSTVGWAALMAS